jgi:hypothetical protein
MAVVVSERRVARCEHCEEGVAYRQLDNILFTVHTSRYSSLRNHNSYSQDKETTDNACRQHRLHSAHISLLQSRQETTGSDSQFCSPDDGHKDARNMLKNN